jgi:hypothetical protein
MGFQEPVAPAAIDTPLHQILYLTWDCDLLFPSNSASFINNLGQICLLAAVDAVDKGAASSTTIYYPDVEVLIDDQRAWQLHSPPSGTVREVEIMNSPFIVQLTMEAEDDGSGETTEDPWKAAKAAGNTHILYGTESAQYWSFITMKSADYTDTTSQSLIGTSQLTPSGAEMPQLGGHPTAQLFVKPGDRVVVRLLDTNGVAPHGLVMGLEGSRRNSEHDVERFFEVNHLSVTLETTDREQFLEAFENPPYGYTHSSLGPLTIFDGYVNDNRQGAYLFFTSYTYGPGLMSGAFVVSWD